MSTASFERMATYTANVKRGTISGTPKKQGAPATILTDVPCLPLDSVSAELAQRAGLETPYTLRQTTVDGVYDIRRGDVLVVDSVEYPVRAVSEADWGAGSTVFRTIIVELIDR